MANKATLFDEITADLGANYNSEDETVLNSIIDDVIEDALIMSNRKNRANVSTATFETQVTVLSSNIKKAVKTIYLQRGIEDVKSNSQSGLSNTYDDAMQTMLHDIIRQNKRLFV